MSRLLTRPDRLVDIELATRREPDVARLFHQPGTAIEALASDFLALWEHHRTNDVNERLVGRLPLASGAYVQWLGYGSGIAVECSSNTYLRGCSRLSEQEERR